MAETRLALPADLEEKIRRARVPGLIRAIAGAENRAAVARARGMAPAAAEEEARALRAELAQLTGAAPPPVHRDSRPENEDAGAAAMAALERLAGPDLGAAPLEDLRRELAAEDAPPLCWPEMAAGADEQPQEVQPAPPPVRPPPPAAVVPRTAPRRAACRREVQHG